jgi:hypothetical protein
MYPLNHGVDRVTVGWRPEFGSFYAHVYLEADGSGWPCPSHEIGDDFDEVTDPQHIIDFISQFAPIPEGLAATLHADAEKEGVCDLPALLAIQQPRSEAYDLDEALIPF